jgi:hypothetical protein
MAGKAKVTLSDEICGNYPRFFRVQLMKTLPSIESIECEFLQARRPWGEIHGDARKARIRRRRVACSDLVPHIRIGCRLEWSPFPGLDEAGPIEGMFAAFAFQHG